MQHLGRQPYTAITLRDTAATLYDKATLTALLLSIHMSHTFTMQVLKDDSLQPVRSAV